MVIHSLQGSSSNFLPALNVILAHLDGLEVDPSIGWLALVSVTVDNPFMQGLEPNYNRESTMVAFLSQRASHKVKKKLTTTVVYKHSA